jgi:predicted enzyme related to lactoylglutathione lyase
LCTLNPSAEERLWKGVRTIIDQVRTVSVPVSDQERAKDFHPEHPRLRVETRGPFGNGMRWIEVAPEGSTASLTLVTWFGSMPPGSLQGPVVATDDIRATHEEPVARGVPFDFPPTQMPGGTQAVFRDPDGNGVVLWERP